MRSRILLLVAGVVASLLVIVPAASAADAPPEIPLSIDKSQFQPSEVKVKANAPFVLVITNKGAKAAEFESKDLRVEKVVPAGKTVNVRIRALKPGTYAFIDDFNHQATGRIVAE
ncbi:MAG: cupredoxin domain-containing protein [Candidatus Rokuibacteriota bacterium]|nr:MAG: cupredoxin domain-containing protein [Candidatus Rokubacteria bacterium]